MESPACCRDELAKQLQVARADGWNLTHCESMTVQEQLDKKNKGVCPYVDLFGQCLATIIVILALLGFAFRASAVTT